MSLRIPVVLAMLAAGLVLVASAGAGASAPSAPKALDLSTMKEIKSYLRSLGVNPRSIKIQRAKKNYAGPNCPGKGWNCTKATRVLQVGSQNFFECTDATTETDAGGTQICIGAMQTGDKNVFRCIERTSGEPANQQCGVTQSGVDNYALFEQVADQSTSTDSEQDATQSVMVHQQASGSTGRNQLRVFQRVKQSMTTPGGQKQDAHQVVRPATGFINIQDASGPGRNYADVHQYIDQRASGAATTQDQNTELVSDPVVGDCVPTSDPPSTPNQCVEGSQSTGAGGQNHSQLHLLIDQDAKTTLEDAFQTQGHFTGGIDARVHQTVGGLTGSSKSHANAAMRQNVAAATGSVQVQIDPTRCCGVSQTGGMGNLQAHLEGGSQHSDGNTSAQELTLIGECNTVNGSCFVTHQARNDEDHANYKCGSTGDECPPESVTACESSEAEDNEGSGQCFTPDDSVDLTDVGIFTESTFLPGTPLSGFEVTMGLVEPDLSLLP